MLTHKIDLSGCVFVATGGQIDKTHMRVDMAIGETGLLLAAAHLVASLSEEEVAFVGEDDNSVGGVKERKVLTGQQLNRQQPR